MRWHVFLRLKTGPSVGQLCLACGLAVLWVGFADSVRAQAFVVTGGSSSISRAHGGALEMRSGKRAGRIDIGSFGKTSVGFSMRQNYRGLWIDAGDQPISFTVPTDVSGISYYFLGRGISVERKMETGSLTVFAGSTSNGFRAPFVSVARSESPAAAILYERQIAPSVRWFSRNLFSRRMTTLQSVEWSAKSDLTLAMTAGLGSGEGYWASTVKLNKEWLIVDGGYIRSGAAFRRIVVQSPRFAENDRENVRVELIPARNLRFVMSRDNYVSPLDSGLPIRAAVNGVGFWTSLAGTQFHGSLFQSATTLGRSQALALGTRRAITRRIETGVNYLSNGRLFSNKGTFMATVRETLNARLSFNQVITRSGGQTAISYGGSLLSNLVTITADYQTVFLPFLSAGPGQFRQVLMLGLHFQLPHGIQVHGDTSISPAGKVRYTTYATTYGYRAMSASPGASASGGFFRYVVRGRVVDTWGTPLEGAAVMVGKDMAFTNSQGHFFLRLKKAQGIPFAVALNEFVVPGRYQVVSAPSSVLPALDGDEVEYEVVVRRLPNAPDVPETDPFEE